MKPAESLGTRKLVGLFRFLFVAILGPIVIVFCMMNFYPLTLWLTGPWQRARFEEASQQLDATDDIGSFDSTTQ